MTTTILLHDLGDPDAGERWRAAIDAVVGDARWAAPDLPGHGHTVAPRNGAYDPMAVVTWLRRQAVHPDGGGLVVGVGQNAHTALLLAAGNGCRAAVVVDGLHGPFRTPEKEVVSTYATLRAIAADPAATGPPPEVGLDPRTSHGYGVAVSAPFLKRFWGSVTVPVLVLETPRSMTPPAQRRERVGWFGGPTTSVELDTTSAEAVLAAVAAWPGREG